VRHAESSDRERLIARVRAFRGRRVVALVDLVVDEFVHGEIERVSREAPVLILRHERTLTVPGGGGNAVANLRALGARPVPVGIVGRDEAGRRLLEHFRALGVPTAAILIAADRETPTKSRVMAGGVHTRRQQIVRIDRGTGAVPLGSATRRRLEATLRRSLARAEVLLVADYGYGVATPEVLAAASPALDGVEVTVDSRSRVARYRGISACTPNQEELEQAVGIARLADDETVERAGRTLLRRSGAAAVLVTRGARGMCLLERRRAALRVPAFGSDEVADVTGAGDTVTAVFALARAAGAGFAEAARLANYAAGLVVMKAGTATVGPDELIAAIREDPGP